MKVGTRSVLAYVIGGVMRVFGKSMKPSSPMLGLLDRIRPASGAGDRVLTLQSGADYDAQQYLEALRNWQRRPNSAAARRNIALVVYERGEGVHGNWPDAVSGTARRGTRSCRCDISRHIYLRGSPSGSGRRIRKRGSERHRPATTMRQKRTSELLFPNGLAVEKNYDEAMRYMTGRRSGGKTGAQAILGEIIVSWAGDDERLGGGAPMVFAGGGAGNASGEFGLGDIYYQGLGVEKDRSTAADWYQKAADHDDPRAQVALGSLYLSGEGRPQDVEEAGRLFTKAAEAGDLRAHYNVASMYLSGRGMPENLDRAETHLRKSAKQNYLPAILEPR